MRLYYIVFLLSIFSCNLGENGEVHYKVIISSASLEKGTSSTMIQDIPDIDGQNDTTAFLKATELYWTLKIYYQMSNEDYYKTSGYNLMEIPFYFTLYKHVGKDSTIIEFDSTIATKLALPVIEKVKKDIKEFRKTQDSITNNPKADIY